MDFTKSFERLNESFKDIMPLKHGYDNKEQFSNYRYADCHLDDACPFKNIGAEAYLLLPETKIKKKYTAGIRLILFITNVIQVHGVLPVFIYGRAINPSLIVFPYHVPLHLVFRMKAL